MKTLSMETGFCIDRRMALAGGALLLIAARRRSVVIDALQTRAFVMSAGYRSIPQLTLPNTTGDGNLVAATFEDLKLQTIQRVVDPTPETFSAQFASFLAGVDSNTIAILYLCGHGVQIAGQNYILLDDGKTYLNIVSIVEAARRATPTVVLLLDACRNNPYAAANARDGSVTRAVTLAPAATRDTANVEFRNVATTASSTSARLGTFELQGSGVKIIFATDPQNFALDGVRDSDTNGPFASAVAKRFRERKSLDDVVSLVTGDVIAATDGTQSPWSQGSLGRPIFLAGPPINVNPARVPFQVPG